MILRLLAWLALLPAAALSANPATTTDDDAQAAIAKAREALAASGVAAEATVRGVKASSWPDQRLGCPGEVPRAPAPARGHRVVLEAEGLVYRVHVSEGRAMLCGKALRVAGAPLAADGRASAGRPPDAASDPHLEAARKDLARRLSAALDAIRVVERSEVTWPDSSLGCPQAGLAYMQVSTPGYRIRLESGGRVFSYHGAQGAPALFCAEPAP